MGIKTNTRCGLAATLGWVMIAACSSGTVDAGNDASMTDGVDGFVPGDDGVVPGDDGSLPGDDGSATDNGGDPSCPTDCDDQNPCTDDSCDPVLGCVHVKNGLPCADCYSDAGRTTAGRVFFVAPGGNDLDPGTEAKPWQHIAEGARRAVAGDTVFVRSGTYFENVTFETSGAAESWITFAVPAGEEVIIDGTNSSMDYYVGMFDLPGISFVVIYGFHFQNCPGAGIRIESGANNIVVRNNVFTSYIRFSPIRTGWSAGTSNILIEGNVIDRSGGDYAEMISISDTKGVTVRNNHIKQNPLGEGIDLKDGTSDGKVYANIVENTHAVGIYLDARGEMRNIEIFNNFVHTPDAAAIVLANESDDAADYGGKAVLDNISIFNNIIYGSAFGIRIAPFGNLSGTGTISNVKLVNNVFSGNAENDVGLYPRSSVQSLIIRNNIFFGDTLTLHRGSTIVDHNLFDSSGNCVGTDCVIGDPQVVNPSGGDFHIRGGSPAVDAGVAAEAPSFDFDGNTRPAGSTHDLGAYEYGAEPGPWCPGQTP